MPLPIRSFRHIPPAAALLALLLLASPSWAAPSTNEALTGPKWTVQIDPLTTALGFVHLQVERMLTRSISLYAGPHIRLFDSLLDDKVEPFKGFGLEVGVRWFPGWLSPADGTPAGLWTEARGVMARLSTDGDGAETGPGGYGSVLMGYTWIFDGRWVLAAGGGVQYLHYRIDQMGPKGVLPAAHTTLGVAF